MWELFHGAVERNEPDRQAFLEEGCAGDRALRRRLEELLTAHEKREGLLDRPLALEVIPRGELESAAVAILEPGDVLSDRFEIVRKIGEGGMGVVYAAFDRELQTAIALKVLRAEIAHAFDAVNRFRTEITLARRVTHPNVCRLFDFCRDGDSTVFLTMELLIGETLADRVRRQGPVAVSRALSIIEQVVAALSAAHKVGVIHGDLKDTNVMLVSENDRTRVVVTDFGLATTAIRGTATGAQAGAIVALGTPAFMAPEQLTGEGVSRATDVYALGLLIYRMVTGRLPIETEMLHEVAALRLDEDVPSPRRFLPDLDAGWEQAILGCLERSPTDRLQEPADVLARLRRATP